MGGGGSSGGSSYPQFNAQQAITQQQTSNLNTAAAQQAMNQVNQQTPFGSLNYSATGSYADPSTGTSVPTYTATTTLSPTEQNLLSSLQGIQGGQLGAAQSLLPQVQQNAQTPLPSGQDFQNQAYNDLMARQNQQYNIQSNALQSQLANQGINPGSTAWNNAYLPLNQQMVDATNQAQLSATGLAGQQEQQQIAAQQAPIQEMQALTGQGGQLQTPQFVNTPQTTVGQTNVEAPLIAGYQGQLAGYNQQLAQQNAMMGGLFGLGGSIGGGLASNSGLFSGLFGGSQMSPAAMLAAGMIPV